MSESCAPCAAASAQAEPSEAARRAGIAQLLHDATGPEGYLGAVALVAERGGLVDLQAFGSRDLARREPLQPDAIFRIYSMSKPFAAVATMMLVEQARLALDDPVARFIPEYAKLQVLVAGDAGRPALRRPARALTIRHLLTHTPGFATGIPGTDEATRRLERAELQRSADLREFADRLARAPLAADPGARYQYDGVQYELLGRVIELASGQPLERFVRERIIEPLRLADTGFSVPAAQRRRIADITTLDDAGRLAPAAIPSASQPGIAMRPYTSLAGGLYATARDYFRFCQMLLQGGSLDGERLLTSKSTATMLSDQLPASATREGTLGEAGNEGVALGGWVILSASPHGRPGAAGSYGWLGAASTYFMIDPQLQRVQILMLQHLPSEHGRQLPKLQKAFFKLAYAARRS